MTSNFFHLEFNMTSNFLLGELGSKCFQVPWTSREVFFIEASAANDRTDTLCAIKEDRKYFVYFLQFRPKHTVLQRNWCNKELLRLAFVHEEFYFPLKENNARNDSFFQKFIFMFFERLRRENVHISVRKVTFPQFQLLWAPKDAGTKSKRLFPKIAVTVHCQKFSKS